MNVSLAATVVLRVPVVINRSHLPLPVQWFVQFDLDFASRFALNVSLLFVCLILNLCRMIMSCSMDRLKCGHLT